MSIMATTFSALAMNITFLREQGVLKRVRGTPLPTGSYLAAIGANAVTNACCRSRSSSSPARCSSTSAGPRTGSSSSCSSSPASPASPSLGVAWSHVIPNFDAAAAYENIVFLPVIFISGVFYDADTAPAFLHDIAQVLPLAHIIDGLSRRARHRARTSATTSSALAVIALWAAFGVLFAVRGFRWESRRA